MTDSDLQFFKVARPDAVREGRGRSVFAGTTRVALFRVDGEIYAVKNFCPHAGSALAPGRVNGLTVECPRHGWRFNLADGRCLTNKMYSIPCYPTKIEDGWVWVGLQAG